MNEFFMRGLGRIFGRNNRRLRTNEKKQEMQVIVLNSNSTISLRCDFTTALNSIKADCMSADFIDWNSMSQTEIDKLIDEIIKSDYVLSTSSHEFLTTNIKVVLKSLEKDIESIRFVAETAKRHPLVFKHLILNGYHFSDWELKNRHLKYFLDAEVYETTCKVLEIYKDDDKTYIERLNKIIVDFINSKPTIQTFDSIFQYVAEEDWKRYKKSNCNDYDNIFGKICAELRGSNDFNEALENLLFMDKMQEVLGEKYNVLHKAMQEYFRIFHNEKNNKSEKMMASKDIIADLSALYVAKGKENRKKKILELQHNWLREFFTLKLENPYVNKKIIQFRKKEQFKNAYLDKDKEARLFIDGIAQTYYKTIDSKLVDELIYAFLICDCSKLDDIIDKPLHYDDYERYEKALKLIKRLNNGYITYEGTEVLNYKDIISYDITTNKYVYAGIKFSETNLKNFSEYRKILQVFLKIKKDIMSKIQTVVFDGEIDDSTVENLEKELPFTDKYFEFDVNYVLSRFNLYDIMVSGVYTINPDVLECDESFNNIYNLLINNSLMWLLLFNDKNYNHLLGNVVNKDIFKIINDMINTLELAKCFNLNTNNYGELLSTYIVKSYADKASVAILGKDIIGKLCRSRDFVDYDDRGTVIKKAKGLICQMTVRSKSTVPYVRGKHLNYNYSLYDSQDESILLAGIDTDACFKVCGNDNDFLHYCALDKNGFVIKITDDFGNFIARAAGFRHGNCIYLNQLRTIYDSFVDYNHVDYEGSSETERIEIIETLQTACADIIETSLNNQEEENKIEFVFTTQSCSLTNVASNVPDDVEAEIGEYPMDTESGDWHHFIRNTFGLQYGYSEGFTTDYENYPLICLAGIKSPEDLTPSDIKRGDVPALYERQRNKIIVSDKPTESLIKKVNRIKAIASWYAESEFEMVYIPASAKIFLGDNWYIIYDNNKVIDGILLADDEKAKVEFDAVMKILEDYTKEMNLAEFISKSQTSNLSVEVESDFVKSIGTLQ